MVRGGKGWLGVGSLCMFLTTRVSVALQSLLHLSAAQSQLVVFSLLLLLTWASAYQVLSQGSAGRQV